MKVIFSILGDSKYYIGINELPYKDKEIAQKLSLSFNEYIKILIKFNAFVNKYDEYIFKKEEDCRRCVEYLEETYGIILALEE